MNRRERTRGFTIVELLVVVSIIALLIAIIMPAFRGAKTAAKVLECQATITSISSSLDTFRTEKSLSGVFPPSASDASGGGSGPAPGQIDDPYRDGNKYVDVSGASLLVLALAGPDNRGTVGFSSSGGAWSAETGGPGSGELYDPTVNATRYGPYAEGRLLEAIRPLAGNDLQGRPVGLWNKGVVKSSVIAETDFAAKQRFFVDTFERPILYYRARKSARFMITNPATGVPGVYDHRDNALLTGGIDHRGTNQGDGTRFSSSVLVHAIKDVRYDSVPASGAGTLNANGVSEYFDSFILDASSVAGSLRPVNAESYLLISAGPDGVYGTKDDVKNWGK